MEKERKRRIFYDLKRTTSSFWRVAASGFAIVYFLDDVTSDKSGRMNSEAFSAIVPARVQPNARKHS